MISLKAAEALAVLLFFVSVSCCKGASNFQNLMAIWRHYSGQVQEGNSSYFGYYPGGGACFFDPLTTDYSHRGWIKVAAGDGEFQKSLGCGMCVEIKGDGILADLSSRAKIPKTPIIGPIYAIVIDRCGNCQKGFDLYAPGSDVWKTKFRAIDCPRASGVNGNIKFRFVDSNPWALKLQTRNARVVTVGLEVLHNGKWVCLPKTEDNYFLLGSPNRVKFPLRVRLTSVSGEQLESTISELRNDVDIASSVQFSGFIKGSDPRSIQCYGQGTAVDVDNNEKTVNESFCINKYDGLYNDPSDCTAYFQCLRGRTTWSHCPRGQLFNAIIKTCDNPKNFPCQQRSVVNSAGPRIEKIQSKIVDIQSAKKNNKSASESEAVKAFCNGKLDGFYDDPSDCQAFFQCLNRKSTKRFCLKGLVFNSKLKTCTSPHTFPCRERPATLDTKPSQKINLISAVIDKGFCLDRANGSYADPYDCSSFYTCLKGEAKRENCPKALRYNYNTGECDWPANVKCKKQPLFRAWIHKIRDGTGSDNQGLTIHGSITRVTAVAREHIIHKPDDEIIIVNENDVE
ncbi:uncharacterized protein [Montipora foliosa]|uniref:uncharacterized protein n=1 Tax=Montipora foliosa TaxID=591990 RepID=UPI0035F109E9